MTLLIILYILLANQNSWIKVAKIIILPAQQNWSAHSPPSGGHPPRCFSLMVVLNSLLLLSIGCLSFLVRLKNLFIINTRCASHTYTKNITLRFHTIQQHFPHVIATPSIKTINYHPYQWFRFLIATFITFLTISEHPLQPQLYSKASDSTLRGNKINVYHSCLKFNISQQFIPAHSRRPYYDSNILTIIYTRPPSAETNTNNYEPMYWYTVSKTPILYACCLFQPKTSVFQKTSGSKPSKLTAPLPSKNFDIDKACLPYTIHTWHYLTTQPSTTSTTYTRICPYYYCYYFYNRYNNNYYANNILYNYIYGDALQNIKNKNNSRTNGISINISVNNATYFPLHLNSVKGLSAESFAVASSPSSLSDDHLNPAMIMQPTRREVDVSEWVIVPAKIQQPSFANSEATANCAPAVSARGGTGRPDISAAPSVPCDTDTGVRPLAAAEPKVKARVGPGSAATTATPIHHSLEIRSSSAAKAIKRGKLKSPPRDPKRSKHTHRAYPRLTAEVTAEATSAGLGPRTHHGHGCCTWRAARGPESSIPSVSSPRYFK